MLLGELQGEQKEHEERNDVKWNRLNEKLYVRLLDVNAKRRKENRIYEFILSFIYFQCALRHICTIHRYAQFTAQFIFSQDEFIFQVGFVKKKTHFW